MPRPPFDETPEEKAHAEGFAAGLRSAAISLAAEALRHLGYDEAEKPIEHTALRLAKERAEVIALLREVCREHGDNDWPDDLHLRDVIEKHLLPYLGEEDKYE